MRFFKKEIDNDKVLYGGLIITFAILYIATAFVSWYHAITFFNIANAVWLSVILSFVAEIGQASALFSILLTKNSSKFLTWGVMIILTALQVIGNVVSSYDWIIKHNSEGVESFQKSILFWMQTADPEIFKVVIAWISGALLPIIALSMTALVAQNMDLKAHKAKTSLDVDDELPKEETTDDDSPKEEPVKVDAKDIISEVSRLRPEEDFLNNVETIVNQHKPKTKEEIIAEIQKEEEETKSETPQEQFETIKKEFEDKLNRKVEEEIERIKKIMSEKPAVTGVISPVIKEVLAPGVENYDSEIKTDETLDSSIKEVVKDFNNRIQPQTDLPSAPFVAVPPIEEPILPSVSDEEINEMNQDEYEKKDYLDEEVERMILDGPTGANGGGSDPAGVIVEEPPIIEPEPEPEPVVKHQNGLVEGIGNIVPKHEDDEEKKRIEEQRLERLRQVARQQEELKKK